MPEPHRPKPARGLHDLLAIMGSPDEIAPVDMEKFARELVEVSRANTERVTSRQWKEEDYRRNAAHAVELACRLSSTADKSRLLDLAESWLDLAYRAHRARRS